jgi:hypothetical protein
MRLHMKLPNIPCPPFSPATLRRQLFIDSLCRWGLFLFFMIAMILLQWPDVTTDNSQDTHMVVSTGVGMPLIILGVGSTFIWIAMGSINTSVARQIPIISAWIDAAPAQAESLLAASLQRKPLHHAVRMMLYQRLATLRFHQGDYAQAAAICDELLRQPESSASSRLLQKIPGLGISAATLRPSLLLMLADSHLLRRDLFSAHQCLVQLHHTPLNIGEQLHRNALQTRYEVAAGLYAAAVTNLPEKIRMAELMPTPQCGSIHAMLALAAHRTGNQPVADWLFSRAQLLCGPEQLASLRTQGLA